MGAEEVALSTHESPTRVREEGTSCGSKSINWGPHLLRGWRGPCSTLKDISARAKQFAECMMSRPRCRCRPSCRRRRRRRLCGWVPLLANHAGNSSQPFKTNTAAWVQSAMMCQCINTAPALTRLHRSRTTARRIPPASCAALPAVAFPCWGFFTATLNSSTLHRQQGCVHRRLPASQPTSGCHRHPAAPAPQQPARRRRPGPTRLGARGCATHSAAGSGGWVRWMGGPGSGLPGR